MGNGFTRIAYSSEIGVGKTKKFAIGDLELLIVNVDGRFYAIDALCTHYGGDLSEGKLEGNIITCPNHGSKFDVRDGKVVSPPKEPLGRPEIENLTSYPLRVENKEILVKVMTQ
jgi:nitrite reductase/ring-hydroxylating ferredoxin subunit